MKLAEFAKWAIITGAWDARDLDGGEVQDMAVKCGLLVETVYDPSVHGYAQYAEAGDPYFVFSDEFKASLKVE